uniref:Uncharacterized protein n=1 Tax=Strigops habroptila TaxID=2489341 RepID=A0A672TLW3_STRHB
RLAGAVVVFGGKHSVPEPQFGAARATEGASSPRQDLPRSRQGRRQERRWQIQKGHHRPLTINLTAPALSG